MRFDSFRGVLIILAFVGGWMGLAHIPCLARDVGQWGNTPSEVREWFSKLMQPDSLVNGTPMSCCGEADAYWADEVHVEGDKIVAVITDDRDDLPLFRMHVAPGTRFVVPPNKIVDSTKQRGNPTGHAVIFLGTNYWTDAEHSSRHVLCYVPGAGT